MNLDFALSTSDIAVIVTSIVAVVAVGLWAARNQEKSARGYFLASGRLPWYIIGAAFVSTSVSSEQIVGTVGATYKVGMGIANWEWWLDRRGHRFPVWGQCRCHTQVAKPDRENRTQCTLAGPGCLRETAEGCGYGMSAYVSTGSPRRKMQGSRSKPGGSTTR